MKGEVLVIVVNLEDDGRAIKIEPPKIVLAMRVVVGAEIIEGGDGIDQLANGRLDRAPLCLVS